MFSQWKKTKIASRRSFFREAKEEYSKMVNIPNVSRVVKIVRPQPSCCPVQPSIDTPAIIENRALDDEEDIEIPILEDISSDGEESNGPYFKQY